MYEHLVVESFEIFRVIRLVYQVHDSLGIEVPLDFLYVFSGYLYL